MPTSLPHPAPEPSSRSHLDTEAILPLLVRFSLPAIVGMLVNALYNIINRVFVGRTVGALGIAAISINFPIVLMMMASSVIVGVGANALFAIRMGEGRREQAEKVFGNAALLLFALPLVLSIGVALFIDPLLLAIGASGETLPMAREYTLIVLLGAPFGSFSMGMTHFIRTDGHPRTAMSSQILGALINIALDGLFVLGMDKGIAGAAWATVIAQVVTTLYVLSYFLSRRATVKLRRKNLRLDLSQIVLPFLFLGLPHCAMQIASSFINTVLNRSLLQYGGNLAVSTIGIVMSANTILIMPLLGVAQGAQPILGFNFGARRFERVVATFRYACIAVTAYGLLTWALSLGFAPAIVRVFSKDDAELIALASQALPIFNFMLPVIGFQIITSTLFQSIGQPMKALLMSLSRQVIVLLPLLFVLPRLFGLDGIYASFPSSDLLSAMLAAALGWREVRRLRAGKVSFTLGLPASPKEASATSH
ncbi:MAG: MATE family efflux transporter [Myxococcales bacterium]|jgi:putative MATE family efflux protein|nr:MATE family efflux transporter [Myxococcales bacterium]